MTSERSIYEHVLRMIGERVESSPQPRTDDSGRMPH
jgi:hypothetical protein